MAAHPAHIGEPSRLPLDIALSVIPSLPRPLLARFVARAIERLDAEDGDPDLEPDDFHEDDTPCERWQDGPPRQWRIGA